MEPKLPFMYCMITFLIPNTWTLVKLLFQPACLQLDLSILTWMDVFVRTRLTVCSSFMLHLFIHLLPPPDVFTRLCGVRSQHWLSLFTLSWQQKQDVCLETWHLWRGKKKRIFCFKYCYSWLTMALPTVPTRSTLREDPWPSTEMSGRWVPIEPPEETLMKMFCCRKAECLVFLPPRVQAGLVCLHQNQARVWVSVSRLPGQGSRHVGGGFCPLKHASPPFHQEEVSSETELCKWSVKLSKTTPSCLSSVIFRFFQTLSISLI